MPGIAPQPGQEQKQHPLVSENIWLDKYKYREAEDFYAAGNSFFRRLLAGGDASTTGSMDQFMRRFDQLEKEQKENNKMAKEILQRLGGIERQLTGSGSGGDVRSQRTKNESTSSTTSGKGVQNSGGGGSGDVRNQRSKNESTSSATSGKGAQNSGAQKQPPQQQKQPQQQQQQQQQQKEQTAQASKKNQDDDDVDLFGSDEEEESEDAKKVREERLKAYAAKKSDKPVLIAKSNVILDVKPWDDETDMKELEKNVRSVEMEGLLWGSSKLVELAYGIKKLQISCVVVDDKVSIEELSEKLEEFEDFVQSVDVAAFNKV